MFVRNTHNKKIFRQTLKDPDERLAQKTSLPLSLNHLRSLTSVHPSPIPFMQSNESNNSNSQSVESANIPLLPLDILDVDMLPKRRLRRPVFVNSDILTEEKENDEKRGYFFSIPRDFA